MELAIAFLPLAGIAVGVAVWVWQMLCRGLEFGAVLFAAVGVALPIAVTGGIHMDGYCDTSDALASWQDKERKLEILKDPHVGAFALIRIGAYNLVCFALLHELYTQEADAGIGLLYPLSRCFAAWSAMTMQNARKNGMLAMFTDKADRRAVGVILALLTVCAAVGWIWLTFPSGVAGLALCLPVTLWYKGMTTKRFGGVTGDTTGYYLQTVE
ncbi:MAG: adenosylcobinamide-GDP ribazoletransferase, partial [Clostridia bacterium]|nr:adenosylcobinamide-GDP ribazoletransferase [Clostridia bacterium]